MFVETRFFALVAALALLGCAAPRLAKSDLMAAARGIPIYAAGDIADCRRAPPETSGAAATASLLETELMRDRQAMVLVLGDSTYPSGRPAEFAHCYEPTWGKFRNRSYAVPGNHEYNTPAAQGYFDYFGTAAGPARRGYYSVELGGWHIIALNSNLRGRDFSAQLAWLQTDLQQSTAHCTLAFWHHPVFSSGGHGNIETMLPIWRMLADANVELVLSGHDHHYERFAPKDGDGRRTNGTGLRQFVVGTGGARLTPIRPFRTHSEASINASHGVLKLMLRPDAYAWEFLPVEADAPADRGSSNCH